MRSNPSPKSKPLTEFACSTQLAWVSEWIRWAIDELEEFMERTPYRDSYERAARAVARLVVARQHLGYATERIGKPVHHINAAANLVAEAYAILDQSPFEDYIELCGVLELLDTIDRKLREIARAMER